MKQLYLFLSLMIFLPETIKAQDTTQNHGLPVTDSATGITVTNAGSPSRDSLPINPAGPRPHLYRMNYWVSWGLITAATVGNLYAIPRVKDKPGVSQAELDGLDRNSIPSFDRWALDLNYADIEQYDKTSDYFMQAIFASTATLAFDKNIRRDALRLLTLYVETHAVTFSFYNYSFFGPTFQNKIRPDAYYTDVPIETRMSGNSRNSFYSGHMASATASTFFMAKVYNDYHPEFSTFKKYSLYGLACLPPLAVGYYRVKALKHFPSDVMVGFVVGAICGIAVPELHRFKKQAIRYGLTATPVGPGLCLTWRPGDVP